MTDRILMHWGTAMVPLGLAAVALLAVSWLRTEKLRRMRYPRPKTVRSTVLLLVAGTLLLTVFTVCILGIPSQERADQILQLRTENIDPD